MKLTTNYNRKNWLQLCMFLSITVIIMGVPTIYFTELVFIPLLDEWVIMLDFLNEKDIITQYANFTVTDYIENKLPDKINLDNVYQTIHDIEGKAETVLLFWFIIMIAPIAALVFMYLQIFRITYYLSNSICTRLGFNPMMKLVVFYNGKAYQ